MIHDLVQIQTSGWWGLPSAVEKGGANENELNDGYTLEIKRGPEPSVSLTACRDVSSDLNPDSSLTLMITMLVSARVPLYLSYNHKQGSQPHPCSVYSLTDS